MSEQHEIIVVEQCDDKPFNRGKLINVGFLETGPHELCVNDVDMIPSYYPAALITGVVQCAKSNIQVFDYLGGCTIFSSASFVQAEGYHNNYFHRAEDNEMMFNLKRKNIHVMHVFVTIRELPHPRNSPEFIPELWVKSQMPRRVNMLKTCQYSVISKEQMTGYMLIKVKI